MPHRFQATSCRFLLMACLVTLLSFANSAVAAPDPQGNSPIMVPNPATDLWRAVRQRDGAAAGGSQVRGVETGVLIQTSGEEFRNFRRQDFIGNAGLVLVAFAGLVLVFYLIRGRIPMPGGRSGKRILRFRVFDRILHWSTAILFITLALTGLTLLFGRFIILPLLGSETFGVVAALGKDIHDLVSPLFLIALVLLLVRFGLRNLPHWRDLKWIIKGGGIIGNAHVSAGYFNAGEKIWFWSVMLLGTVVSASGLALWLPIFGLEREIMQLALIVHGIASVLFIAGSFGHIYIGTIGTEGSLESMTTGYVDENWAEGHHDLWYAEVKGESPPTEERPVPDRQQGNLRTSTDKA